MDELKKEKLDESNTERKSVYELLEESITASDISQDKKTARLSRLIRMREKKANIMLVGATGSGKSSTVNALFNMEVAKVGAGVDPETDSMNCYVLDNLTIWDTPGLGDDVKRDEEYKKMLIKKLNETDENGDLLIDLVLVVLDASSKDLRTTYDLINNILVPCLGEDNCNRILVGLNQADMAMKGKHWDEEKNAPDDILLDYLKDKVISVEMRLIHSTHHVIKPIFYCAGYKDESGERKPYNLTKLLYYILKSIPKDKRLALVDNINPDDEMWLHNDKEENYKEEVKRDFFETIGDCIDESAELGMEMGETLLGIPGVIVGAVVGATFGAAFGAVKGFFEGIFE